MVQNPSVGKIYLLSEIITALKFKEPLEIGHNRSHCMLPFWKEDFKW